MQQYEIVINARRHKEEIRSLKTYKTYEEAQADLESINAAKKDGESIDIPWLKIESEDVVSARIEMTTEIRSTDPRTASEILQQLQDKLVEGDDEPEPEPSVDFRVDPDEEPVEFRVK